MKKKEVLRLILIVLGFILTIGGLICTICGVYMQIQAHMGKWGVVFKNEIIWDESVILFTVGTLAFGSGIGLLSDLLF